MKDHHCLNSLKSEENQYKWTQTWGLVIFAALTTILLLFPHLQLTVSSTYLTLVGEQLDTNFLKTTEDKPIKDNKRILKTLLTTKDTHKKNIGFTNNLTQIITFQSLCFTTTLSIKHQLLCELNVFITISGTLYWVKWSKIPELENRH